jgi:hypothetical protein
MGPLATIGTAVIAVAAVVVAPIVPASVVPVMFVHTIDAIVLDDARGVMIVVFVRAAGAAEQGEG